MELNANESGVFFTNPILPGGYPDPSICRVGDTFYLVNSSFEYFPGLPLHQSKDLVNWECVGNALHREAQLDAGINLSDVQTKGGIHAASIRHHNGLFYVISTNVYQPADPGQATVFVNFVITAPDIEGPWSLPHILEDAPGIDPDIFFDDDGRVWYVGTHSPADPNFEGEGEIWLQEIDLDNWRLVGQRIFLWRGACGGVWVEGPHIYKHDERYYLMVAEGGTSFNHAVMIAVSDRITGPYLPNPRNPILTTRHLSYDNWVHSVGHADLVSLPDGRWYMVVLGVRGEQARSSNMGRETHLVPVRWEREPFEWKETRYMWPVCAPDSGRVERLNPMPFTINAMPGKPRTVFEDDFESEILKPNWNFRRRPVEGGYSLKARSGCLRLFTGPGRIVERGRSSFMGFRQTESDFEYRARMFFSAGVEGVEGGICLMQQDDQYLSWLVSRVGNQVELILNLVQPGSRLEKVNIVQLPDYQGEIIFRVKSDQGVYQFDYTMDNGRTYAFFGHTGADLLLSRGYTGAYLGLYAFGNGKNNGAFADFDWVRYRGYSKGAREYE